MEGEMFVDKILTDQIFFCSNLLLSISQCFLNKTSQVFIHHITCSQNPKTNPNQPLSSLSPFLEQLYQKKDLLPLLYHL